MKNLTDAAIVMVEGNTIFKTLDLTLSSTFPGKKEMSLSFKLVQDLLTS